jgi:hypothetical protein
MLFRKTVAVYCENHMEHTDTLCGAEWLVYVVTTEFYKVKNCGGGDVVACRM